MEEKEESFLDALELSGRDREVVAELLELPSHIKASCSNEYCAFYSLVQLHTAAKVLDRLTVKVSDAPVMVYVGENVSVTALLVPPHVHIVILVRRMQVDEPT